MASPLSDLDAAARNQLLQDLNYLNTSELRGFCRKHGISWRIYVAQPDGGVRATKDNDRKAIVLGRVRTLRRLTNGRFRDSAIARILLNEFWTKGEAPTMAEFASSWSRADSEGLGIDRGDHPEAAYLTDRARGSTGADWKAKRTAIAKRVLAVLDEL